MSHLEEFLAFVLPWDGEEAHTWKSVWENTEKPGKDGRPIFAGYADNTISGLANKARVIDTRWQHDVYIGLGSQSESLDPRPGGKWRKSLRRGYNISAHQCLFADIDVGKVNAYVDQREAVQDLLAFCARIKFPDPSLLMDSGSGGLHVYWRFERWVRAAEWQPMANALATLLSRNIKCDAGVTKDVARILRPPESHNYKHRDKGIITQVRMGQPGKSYPVEQIRAALKVPHLYVASVTEKPRSGLNAALAEMPATVPAIALDVVADAGCAVFKEAILTGGRDYDYPLWFLMLCAARFDPDPHGAAHMVSEEHDDYSFTETQQKIETLEAERKQRDVGWPHCREFDRLSPHCAVCPHLKEGKTPFHLVWPPKQSDTADPEGSPGLPPHFTYDADGYLKGYSVSGKSQVHTTILRCHVYDGALDENGDLVFKADVGKVPRFVSVSQGVMSSARDCMRVLFEQGLRIDKDHFEAVRRFIVAFSEMLQHNLKARIKTQPFGWTEEDGFCYGGKTITPTGEEPAYQREANRLMPYAPKGSLDVWKKTTRYVTDQGRPELEVLLATAFAAPLLKMSLSQAVLLSVYSRESGIGKSTALKIGQAVWGHPITGVNGLDDTENAIIAKVGDLRHLPLYWDEMKTKDQYQRVINVTFQLGQGKNKARLDRDSNARVVTSFATMMTACSNDSLFNIVVNGTKGTRAGAYRVFEVVVPPMTDKTLSMTDVSADVAELERNYGRAGEVYAQFLGQKAAVIQQEVRNIQRHLEQALGTAPNERFWLATMAALLAGANYARQLGLVDFHVMEMGEVLSNTFVKLRDRLAVEVQEMQSAVDGEEFLDGLISSLFNKQLVITTRIHNGTKPKMDIKLAAGDAMHLSNVWAQIGVQENVLRVKAGPFREYIGKSGYNYTEVKHVLINHFGMRLEFATVGAGVPIFGGAFDRTQSRCYDIDLPASVVTTLPSSPSASSD